MPITIFDRASYKITQREFTDEGFLRVPGRVARTGVQTYLARELQLDGDPMRLVKVYRSPDEVFRPESLATYNSAVLTNDHPAQLVNAETYRQLSIGNVAGPGVQDGDYVLCELVFKDAKAIKDIIAGKVELSAGYTAEYVEQPGVTADGEPYDYIQRDIKINHVAAVHRARAGAGAKVFDTDPTPGGNMPVLITTDSGRSVDVADPANAQVVADHVDRLTKRVADAEAATDVAKATADKALEDLAEARKASSDEAITARVALIADAQAGARAIAGEDFTCDSHDPVEIKRAALAIARPKVAWGDKSAAYVEAAFDAESEKDEGEEDDKKKKPTGDSATLLAQLTQLAQDAARAAPTTTADAAPTAYEQHKQRLRNGHKAVNKGE